MTENHKKTRGVWVATLERFGYTMMVVDRTKQKAVDAIVDEYKKAYLFHNGFECYSTMEQDEEFKECFSMAMEEVYCRFMEYGKMEWC